MYTSSLTPTPAPARIQSDAARIAAEIRATIPAEEAAELVAYGRRLLDNQPIGDAQTLRFVYQLHHLAYRLPTYLAVAAHLSHDLPTLRDLQQEIARQVAQAVQP